MFTLTQTTASDVSLEELESQVRRLWSTKLDAPSGMRSDLISRLCDIEITLERASIRSTADSLAPDDYGEIRRCHRQLIELERAWKPEATTMSLASL